MTIELTALGGMWTWKILHADGTLLYVDPVQYTSESAARSAILSFRTDVAAAPVLLILPDPPAVSPLSPVSVQVGQVFSLTASATGDGLLTYLWGLGDGSTAQGQTVSYSYPLPGQYVIDLTVTDQYGQSATTTTTATITAIPIPVPPPVTTPTVDTPWDKFPNVAKAPTIQSAKSGWWSDSDTWDIGRVPQLGDVVSVSGTTRVEYDQTSDDPITLAIQPNGLLYTARNIGTRLTLLNGIIHEGGEWDCGTAADPMPYDYTFSPLGVRADVVFADVPLDAVSDPKQYGRSLIVLGKLSVNGMPKTSFMRLAAEVLKGQTSFTLEAVPDGWNNNDRLVFPDSRQLRTNEREANWVPVPEVLSAAGATTTATFSTQVPTAFSHPSGRNGDGVIETHPHVQNLSRSVIFRSANSAPTATRGIIIFTWRAEPDCQYGAYHGLGRTLNTPISATNLDDRFGVMFHHLMGPKNPAGPYQFKFIGNAVLDSGGAKVTPGQIQPLSKFKWGVSVNDSHYGRIAENVLFNWAGCGIATKGGGESSNLIEDNHSCYINGTGDRNGAATANIMGCDGLGYWFRGPFSVVRRNVACTAGGKQVGTFTYGFNFFFLNHWAQVKTPKFQGADTSIPAETVLRNANAGQCVFEDCEAYGVDNGMTYWYVGINGNSTIASNAVPSTFKRFKVWNYTRWGLFAYHSGRLTLEDWSIHCYPTFQQIACEFNDYEALELTVKNLDAEGAAMGVTTPRCQHTLNWSLNPNPTGGKFVLEGGRLRCVENIVDWVMWHNGVDARVLVPKHTTIRNVRQEALPGRPKKSIARKLLSPNGTINLTRLDQLFVEHHNFVPGDNFQVFYPDQAPDAILLQTIQWKRVGCPVAGLTNTQALAQHGVAFAGAVSPTAATRPDIVGFVQ